jgi:hypothetical protein
MYFPNFGVLDLSLLRRSFDADPIPPLQPQAAYYVARNLATMLDELEPGELDYSIQGAPKNLEAFPLRWPRGHALALWLGGRATDRCPGVPVDVRLGIACRKATAYDPLNGVRQELRLAADGDRVRIPAILVRDWPLIIRLDER